MDRSGFLKVCLEEQFMGFITDFITDFDTDFDTDLPLNGVI